MRSLGSWLWLGAVLFLLVPSSVLVAPRPAAAQSAADKATARGLAREGIKLFKAGKFADALDKLQRAQSLYDAPVHLIYIARCQDKLGLVVESTETYRKLVRLDLDDGAPDAFKQAVADAKKELPEVEPKLASIKIEVQPANIEGLKLSIDEVNVSSAVVGVDRPANPGTRKITASAPGYHPSEQTVELKAGDSKTVSFALEVDEEAGAAGGTGGTGAKGGNGGSGGEGGAPEPEPTGVGFMAGLRLGGGTTFGDMRSGDAIKDYYGPFTGGELRVGVRIARRYTPVLFAGGYVYQVGGLLNQFPDNNASTADASTTAGQVGVGFQYAPPPNQDGIFAELDLIFVHRFETKRKVKFFNPPPASNLAESCTQTLVANGQGFRLMGGYQIGLAKLFQLTPFLGLTLAQVRDVSIDSDCRSVKPPESGLKNTPWETPQGISSGQRAVHGMVTVGVSGDITFGAQ